MKTFIKYLLQKMLGIKTYLYIFALFVIVKIRIDRREKDFFHFLKLLPPEGLVLDLGANIGVTSYHLARALPGSTIFSFEPLPLNMEILRRIKKRFRLTNVRDFLLAAGNENGRVEMVMPVINHVCMHGLSHVVHKDIPEFNAGQRLKVPVVKLDDLPELMASPKRISGVKIDVENFEYFVLKGAEKLIERNRPLIYCELWDNENRQKCMEFLNEKGYTSYTLQKHTLVSWGKGSCQKQNFFFLPEEASNMQAQG